MDANAQMETMNEVDEDIPNETKAARFSRLATKRLRNVMNQMRILGNCSSTATYEYTPEQIEMLFEYIDKSVDELKQAFNPKAKDNDLPSL